MTKQLIRACKIIHQENPRYFAGVTAQQFMTAIRPANVLFFSARVINELSGARNTNAIMLYAALAVGLSFLFSAVSSVIAKRMKVSDNAMHFNFYALKSAAFCEMDYIHAENPKTQETLHDLAAKMNSSGNGLMAVHWNLPRLIGGILGSVISLFLLAGMFGNAGHVTFRQGLFYLCNEIDIKKAQ